MIKKCMFYAVLFVYFLAMPVGIQAYTINGDPSNAIGYPTYATYGINVTNFTPGVNSGSIVIDLFTNYPPTGDTVGAWTTQPADLFITETYYGSQYMWAIPTVTHGAFIAGDMYAVGTYKISDDFDPSPPGSEGYLYNHGVPVQIATLGNNYGYASFEGYGSISYAGPAASMPYYEYSINTGVWEDDPNGVYAILWGTGTCANNVISGSLPDSVPEPATMLLLGLGLIGLAGVRRKFKN